jgi:hypothetical protein
MLRHNNTPVPRLPIRTNPRFLNAFKKVLDSLSNQAYHAAS